VKINGNEITAVYTLLKELYTNLMSAGYQLDPDRPMSIIGNQFPSYEWLKYHPRMSVGGSPKFFDEVGDHGVLVYDPVVDQLIWFNKVLENEVMTSGWHPLTPDRDEQITQL